MFEPQTIVILGSSWEIKYQLSTECEFLRDADGFADPSIKQIVIRADNPNQMGNMDNIRKNVLRHEIIHAYLYECGLGSNFEHSHNFGHEETTIDWFAIMFPKTLKTYQESGVA